MDRWIEILTKYLPGSIIVGLMAIAVTFLGRFYLKRYRFYGDVLHDKFFLNIAVLIAAVVFLYLINVESRKYSHKPLLVVPLFQNDDGNLYRTALSSQLESELNDQEAVEFYDSFIGDADSAKKVADNYSASAVLYKASVIDKDNSTVSCFSILVPTLGLNKSCPMVPLRIPKESLSDLANLIRTGETARMKDNSQIPRDNSGELASKVDELEKQLAEIRSKSDSAVKPVSGSNHSLGKETTTVGPTSERPPTQSAIYNHKYALVIGVDRYTSSRFPRLRYAASDARAVSSALEKYNFDVRLLLNEAAGRSNILNEIRRIKTNPDDLVVVYFSGMTATFGDDEQKQVYVIPSDFNSPELSTGLSISQFKKEVELLPAEHKLVMIDGCYGATGLNDSGATTGSSTDDPKQPAFFFVTATQDNQYAMESELMHGGAFTQSFLHALNDASNQATGMSIQALLQDTQALLQRSKINQQPKLVRIAGTGDILLGKT